MSSVRRIRNILSAIFLLLFAAILMIVSSESFPIIQIIISVTLYIYAFRLLWYYFSMARHMVGGKSILYQGIIVLDFALFASSLITSSALFIVAYLLGIYAFSGAIDILRALEAKRYEGYWKLKLISGIIEVVCSVSLMIFGIFVRSHTFLVYGYCISLGYSAVVRITAAFRKTAIVYIQ